MINKTILEKIRVFDAHPKTLEDFRLKTFGGAVVTIVSALIMFILFVSELTYYLSSELQEELLIDVSKGDKLRINFDIVFPHITCSFLAVDVIDVSGEQHINIEHNVYKRRLNEKGEPLDKPERDESIGQKKKEFMEAVVKTSPAPSTTTLDPERCESCYGAESARKKCCNSCEDVRDAYNDKGWAQRDIDHVIQCKREGVSEKITNFDKEGCQTFGYVEVNRVGGNFHIAPGRSLTKHHVHVHDLSPHDSSRVNMTHRIRHLSFGKNIPGKTNTLDGSNHTADEGSLMFQYYIKIVPTLYVRRDGYTLPTNQFAVTRHKKQSHESLSESGLPGVFFIYEFAPMMIKYSEKQKSFLHFLTSIVGIIGGIFTVAGIIDSVLYHSVRAIQKKIELGKAS